MTDVWDCLTLCVLGLIALAVVWLVVSHFQSPQCPWCRRRLCVSEDWVGDVPHFRCDKCNAHWVE